MSALHDTEVRLRETMAEVLDLDPATIGESFSRGEASAWDSMAHLRLITALEQAFGIRFTMKEVNELDQYGKIRDRIAAHLGR